MRWRRIRQTGPPTQVPQTGSGETGVASSAEPFGTVRGQAGSPGRRPREGERPEDVRRGAGAGNEAGGRATVPPVRNGRGLGWRTREAGATVAGVFGTGVMFVARLVMVVTLLIVLLIALAIVLRDVDANTGNTIVKGIHEGANFFAGAFTGLITFGGHPKRAITVNWGIALVVYLVLGALLSRVISRVAWNGLRYRQAHRPTT
jgi:hypothetical protein